MNRNRAFQVAYFSQHTYELVKLYISGLGPIFQISRECDLEEKKSMELNCKKAHVIVSSSLSFTCPCHHKLLRNVTCIFSGREKEGYTNWSHSGRVME